MTSASRAESTSRLLRWTTARSAVFVGLWVVMVYLALVFIRRDALRYIDWTEATFQRFWPNRLLLATHVAGATVALLVGPLQFIRPIRRRWPRFHRACGWVYAVAVITTTPVAIRLATYTSCPLCVSPFVLWGSVTLIVTVLAMISAMAGSFKVHRDFMIRSYALMYAFVLVRLDAHLLGTPLEIPLAEGTQRNSMVLWVAWVGPLVLIELFVSWIPAVRKALRPKRVFERPPAAT